MAQTPLTNSGSYLTPAAFLARCDARTVGDLCSDNGTRITAAQLLTDANLAAALLDASGEVEAAAMKGARYAPVDLLAISTTTGAAQGKLFRMIARLTLAYLYERRPDHKEKPPATILAIEKQLEELRDGIMVFGTVETSGAQTLEAVVETSQDVENRNLTVVQASRYFGVRGSQRGPN